jgi:hypothetical protein
VRSQLGNRRRVAARQDAARADPIVPLQGLALRVEKQDIEQKAHAECVDAAAPWEQEAGSGGLLVEVCEAEQAGAAARSDWELQAEDCGGREAMKAAGHGCLRRQGRGFGGRRLSKSRNLRARVQSGVHGKGRRGMHRRL